MRRLVCPTLPLSVVSCVLVGLVTSRGGSCGRRRSSRRRSRGVGVGVEVGAGARAGVAVAVAVVVVVVVVVVVAAAAFYSPGQAMLFVHQPPRMWQDQRTRAWTFWFRV